MFRALPIFALAHHAPFLLTPPLTAQFVNGGNGKAVFASTVTSNGITSDGVGLEFPDTGTSGTTNAVNPNPEYTNGARRQGRRSSRGPERSAGSARSPGKRCRFGPALNGCSHPSSGESPQRLRVRAAGLDRQGGRSSDVVRELEADRRPWRQLHERHRFQRGIRRLHASQYAYPVNQGHGRERSLVWNFVRALHFEGTRHFVYKWRRDATVKLPHPSCIGAV